MSNNSFTKNGEILLAIGIFGPVLFWLIVSEFAPLNLSESQFLNFIFSDSFFHARRYGRMMWLYVPIFPLTLLLIWLTPLKKHTGDAFAVAVVSMECMVVVITAIELLFKIV